MKRCPTSLTGQEMQIKTTTRYDFTPTGMALIEKTDSNECCWGCGDIGILIHCWWDVKWYNHFGKSLGILQNFKHWVTMWPSNFTLRFIHKVTENMSTQNLFMNVYSSILHNKQKMKTTQMSIHWWIDVQNMVYPCNGIITQPENGRKYWYTLWPGWTLKTLC